VTTVRFAVCGIHPGRLQHRNNLPRPFDRDRFVLPPVRDEHPLPLQRVCGQPGLGPARQKTRERRAPRDTLRVEQGQRVCQRRALAEPRQVKLCRV